MSQGLFSAPLLTVFLSEGMMFFVLLILLCALFLFKKAKGHTKLRAGLAAVCILCVLYLGAILALVVLFGSSHGPADPVPALLSVR